MATSMTETSYWISFFTSAGIPAGDATHYAILFTDNRISREMLMDINKEYLTDMGITRLGDIIAVLKHCKTVYNQEAKDRVMKSTSFSSSHMLTPKRSTAASRMVNHFTSKFPEAAPMSAAPVPRLPPPDPPKSKRKVSVFERLGDDDSEDISLNSPSPSGVFSRLGASSSLKRSSSIFEDEATLPYAGVLKNSPTPVKRVKVKVDRVTSVSPALSQSALNIKKVINNSGAKVKIIASNRDDSKDMKIAGAAGPTHNSLTHAHSIQRPEVSTTTEGVLSDRASKQELSIRERLGGRASLAAPTDTVSLPMPSIKKKRWARAEAASSSTTLAELDKAAGKLNSPGVKLKKKSESSGIQARLGSKVPRSKADEGVAGIVSSTELEPSPGGAAVGVFSRLGKKSQVSS